MKQNINILLKKPVKMQDVYKRIKEFNPDRKCNALIVFDDIIADMISNKKT